MPAELVSWDGSGLMRSWESRGAGSEEMPAIWAVVQHGDMLVLSLAAKVPLVSRFGGLRFER